MSTPEASVALIVQGEQGLTVDRVAVDAMYAAIETQIAGFTYDLTTETGRKNAASLAYSIAKKRTAIEADKKKLKEGLIVQGRAIDTAWNEIREKLEGYQEQARKPLNDWEEAERVRKERCERTMNQLQQAPRLLATDTSDTAAEMLRAVEAVEILPSTFGADYDMAAQLKNAAIVSLRASVDHLNQREADAAELAKLRAANEAREKADREAAEAAELARLNKEREDREAKRVAEKAEAKRLAEEKYQAERAQAILQAAKDAEERVARQAAIDAENRERELMRKHDAEMTALQIAKDRAEEQQRLEAKRIAEEEQERKNHALRLELAAKEKAETERKLATNKKHRRIVIQASAEVLARESGLDATACLNVIELIVAGKIPAVAINFGGRS